MSSAVSTATAASPNGPSTATAAYSGPIEGSSKDEMSAVGGSARDASDEGAPKRKIAGWKHFVAGGAGGMTGAIVTSPFDVVKVTSHFVPNRLLPTSTPSASSTFAAPPPRPTGARGLLWNFVETGQMIRNIYVNEGGRALFKGLGPTLVGVVPARAINFSTYASSKTFLATHFPASPNSISGVADAEASPMIHLGAATIAGLTTATATNPIWVVKTRLQLEARHRRKQEQIKQTQSSASPSAVSSSARSLSGASARTYATSSGSTAEANAPGRRILPAFKMTMDIMRAEGLPGLYKGLSASYLGVTEGVIQWVLYERLKKASTTVRPGEAHPSRFAEWLGIVGSSGGAKMVASLITYPHEVLRTRLRQPPETAAGRPKYTGLWQTLRLVIKEEGAASLYGGLSAHLMRVVPNAACMFTIYEIAVRVWVD